MVARLCVPCDWLETCFTLFLSENALLYDTAVVGEVSLFFSKGKTYAEVIIDHNGLWQIGNHHNVCVGVFWPPSVLLEYPCVGSCERILWLVHFLFYSPQQYRYILYQETVYMRRFIISLQASKQFPGLDMPQSIAVCGDCELSFWCTSALFITSITLLDHATLSGEVSV